MNETTLNRKTVVILVNAPMPGQLLPCSGPSIRVLGLKKGLEQNGYKVVIYVAKHKIYSIWTKELPSPAPPNTIVLPISKFNQFIRLAKPDYVIFSYININRIEKVEGVKYILDLFAAKLLEIVSSPNSIEMQSDYVKFKCYKKRAISLCDAIIINGEKKLPYYYAWLIECNKNPSNFPITVVPTLMLARGSSNFRVKDRINIGISGHKLAWLDSEMVMEALFKLLPSNRFKIHYFGQLKDVKIEESCMDIYMENMTCYSFVDFNFYLKILDKLDIFIDLNEASLERNYALSTRSVTALCSGVPVIHNNNTELSSLILKYDAGWLIDAQSMNASSIASQLEDILNNPIDINTKKIGALKLGNEQLNPKTGILPLVKVLNSL